MKRRRHFNGDAVRCAAAAPQPVYGANNVITISPTISVHRTMSCRTRKLVADLGQQKRQPSVFRWWMKAGKTAAVFTPRRGVVGMSVSGHSGLAGPDQENRRAPGHLVPPFLANQDVPSSWALACQARRTRQMHHGPDHSRRAGTDQTGCDQDGGLGATADQIRRPRRMTPSVLGRDHGQPDHGRRLAIFRPVPDERGNPDVDLCGDSRRSGTGVLMGCNTVGASLRGKCAHPENRDNTSGGMAEDAQEGVNSPGFSRDAATVVFLPRTRIAWG